MISSPHMYLSSDSLLTRTSLILSILKSSPSMSSTVMVESAMDTTSSSERETARDLVFLNVGQKTTHWKKNTTFLTRHLDYRLFSRLKHATHRLVMCVHTFEDDLLWHFRTITHMNLHFKLYKQLQQKLLLDEQKSRVSQPNYHVSAAGTTCMAVAPTHT